jgi:hypothetical protein
MPRVIADQMVERVVRTLLGAIDTGDGGTDEQRRVLAADHLALADQLLEAVRAQFGIPARLV